VPLSEDLLDAYRGRSVRLLLDTHVFSWWLADDKLVTAGEREAGIGSHSEE
jgi:hypothetical protein